MALASLTDLFSGLWSDTVTVVPTLVGAFLLLLIGWVLGRVVGRTVFEVLKRFKADDYFRLGKKLGISEIVSVLVAWIIYLAFIGATVEFLEIATLTLFFSNILNFLSGLLGGIVVLVVGYFVAGYVQKKILDTKMHYSEMLGQVIFFFTLIITISMAFDIVGIPTDLLNGIILLLVAGIALGLAIALGLGLKDSVAKLAKKYL